MALKRLTSSFVTQTPHETLAPPLGALHILPGLNSSRAGGSADDTAEYTANPTAFIRDVRRTLKSPKLPLVVVQIGVIGAKAVKNVLRIWGIGLAHTMSVRSSPASGAP